MDKSKSPDEDGYVEATNTRPDSDIFEENEDPSPAADDNVLVDTGEVNPDEGTLDDLIASEREDADAEKKAGGEQTLDDDGIIIEAEEDPEAEVEEEKETYGKRAEKAIAKANSAKKAAEDRASKAERDLAELNWREGEARHEQVKHSVTNFEAVVTEKKAAMGRLEEELERAQESGDSKETARILRAMSGTEVDIRENTYHAERSKEEVDKYDRGAKERSRGAGR